jgi:hypothetical protein
MFKTTLVLAADSVPDIWYVVEPLVWDDKTYGRLVVPVGFRTDLASTPLHVDDNGPSRRPAVVHDALYNIGQRLGKVFADQFLRDAILAEGGGRMRSQTYYRAVQWFGGFAWRAAGAQPGASHFTTAGAYNEWLKSAKTLSG